MAARRHRLQFLDGFRPGSGDLLADLDQLLIPCLEHLLATGAGRDLLKQAVALLEDPAQTGERPGVARLDLDQHLVEEAPAELGAGLDQPQVIRPEEGDPEMARKVEGPAPDAIDLDGSLRPIALQVESNRQLFGRVARLDLRLDARAGGNRPDQLDFPPRPRRSRQSQHGDGLEKVGLALAIRADEDVDAGPRRKVQLRVVAVISESKTPEAHSSARAQDKATRTGMIT